ncbi:MAG: peptide ABC transporter permease [Deltaproteobacteria bacterium CG11_big_fil_rev_8_21_14_0_20_45_16]|nr:MAG: peptide ABC transporter permease [Deltaproteobacteria bacterium CG11_big_fil_rev_8_21_14_0_20_45_16]
MMRFLKQIPKLAWISGSFVFLFVLLTICAPWIANNAETGHFFPLVKFGPETADIFETEFLAAPDQVHLMGTDYVGRDVFARLVHGISNSLYFSLAVVAICLILGTIIGGIMGFFGGWIDLVLSRVMEIIGNFPIFLLQLTLLAFLSQGYGVLLFVMTLAGWIPYCRFVRAEFFKLRNQEFVLAAKALGASRTRIFFRHLLPNSLTPVIIYVPFDLSSTIISLGALSFLGFGEPINVASLGELLKQAKDHFLDAWWLAVFPGGALFLMTLSFSLFGASIRDLLDPRYSD